MDETAYELPSLRPGFHWYIREYERGEFHLVLSRDQSSWRRIVSRFVSDDEDYEILHVCIGYPARNAQDAQRAADNLLSRHPYADPNASEDCTRDPFTLLRGYRRD